MDDFEKITIGGADTMTAGLMTAITSVNYQMAGFLIIIYILLSSDTFIGGVLGKFSGAVNSSQAASSYGVFLQSMFLVLAYIIVDSMQKMNII